MGGILCPRRVQAASAAALYGAAGVPLGLECPLVPASLSLRLAAEVLGTIDPPTVTDESQKQVVFHVAGYNAGLGLGILWASGKP